MKRSRFTEERIIGILKKQEAGAKTADMCRKHGISDATFCKYKAKYGGMDVSDETRSALHRCLQRHGISRLPNVEGDKPKRSKFKRYPIGFFHIDIAEVQTAEGKFCLFVGIDRTS